MPVNPTYPGVYVQEIPSGVRTITGVATSITAFIGRALRGPTNKAITITSYSDFERIFGGLWVKSMLGYAVHDFYLNGGSTAIIVRLFKPYYKDKASRDAILADAKKAAQEVIDAINGSAAATPAEIAKAGTDKATEIDGDANRSAEAKTAAKAVAKAGADAGAVPGADKAKIVKAVQDEQTAATDSAVPLTKTPLPVGGLPLEAAYEGSWGNALTASIDNNVSADFATSIGLSTDDLFNLTVQEGPNGRPEVFRNLTLKNSSSRIDKVLETDSRLVRWAGSVPPTPADITALKTMSDNFKADKTLKKVDDTTSTRHQAVADTQAEVDKKQKALDDAKNANPPKSAGEIAAAQTALDTAKTNRDAAKTAFNATQATNGSAITVLDFTGAGFFDQKIGLYALEHADLFNILCIPPFVLKGDVYDIDLTLLAAAAKYCTDRRAILLVDPQSDWEDRDKAITGVQEIFTTIGSDNAKNAAFYFPRLKEPNILRNNQIEAFVPCGAMAGIFARIDTQRGVWKAPAGLEAGVTGVSGVDVPLTDNENGLLNPLAINCLRIFPAAGTVVWGARTLQGNDQLASEWKYVPVRRTALYIEESLYRGLQWVVFEPNDEPLWAQIRLNVGAFMHNLFVKGAFQGATPRDAYFVKCDKETTTQNDINLGIVNIVVGFAPLKPAEFVIISLQQIAGQILV